jgi:hypothetical protein
MSGNPESYNSDKKDIAQQEHHIDLKGGALSPQTPPGSLRLIWAPPPLPPPSPCAVAVSPLAPVALFYITLNTHSEPIEVVPGAGSATSCSRYSL